MQQYEISQESDEPGKHVLAELLEYTPHAVVSKTILKKLTGSITVFAVAAGERLPETFLAYDCYIQLLDGTANFDINGVGYLMRQGEGIVIPGHVKYQVDAGLQFKMLVTIIKSSYED